jgi:hypothetical protein
VSSRQLQTIASKIVLELASPETLPGVAAAELANGRDSPSLRALAALSPGNLDEAKALFERSLIELGMKVPSSHEAVMFLARDIAARILDGTTTPYDGARQISTMSLQANEDSFPELDTFVYAASEWDARPEDGNIFAEGVVAAAQDLMRDARDPPPVAEI